MIIKEIIDFSLQRNLLISALGVKNSEWLPQFILKLLYKLWNLNKISSPNILRIHHFAIKFRTLIS